jgi:hypothetical protein
MPQAVERHVGVGDADRVAQPPLTRAVRVTGAFSVAVEAEHREQRTVTTDSQYARSPSSSSAEGEPPCGSTAGS